MKYSQIVQSIMAKSTYTSPYQQDMADYVELGSENFTESLFCGELVWRLHGILQGWIQKFSIGGGGWGDNFLKYLGSIQRKFYRIIALKSTF